MTPFDKKRGRWPSDRDISLSLFLRLRPLTRVAAHSLVRARFGSERGAGRDEAASRARSRDVLASPNYALSLSSLGGCALR